jgi:hypothetical protein
VVHGRLSIVAAMQNDPKVERKARRALIVLYVVMVVFVLLPLVFWWLVGR